MTTRSPLTRKEVVDEYFIENRTRLLDIAAFLDRLDRAEKSASADFRVRAFREALRVLCEGASPRIERIQMIFSDPTTEPLPVLDQKSARGAFDRWKGDE